MINSASKVPSILVVDDAPENVRLLARLLQGAGCQVRTAISARRGLQSARLLPPDLILLDIRMPEVDGLEMCAQLKQDEQLSSIPVIFISALHATEEKIKAFEAGGVDYITKPFQAAEVLARVQTHLKLQRQKHELEASYAQLAKSEELRDSLVHMVVHDMKSPLMFLQGCLKMVENFDKRSLSPLGQKYLGEANRGVDRLFRLATDILLTSRMESGKMRLNLKDFDLLALCRQVVPTFAAAWPGNPITVNAEADQQIVCADQDMTERILQNLIDNALKYSPDGSPVSVTVIRQPGLMRVEIADRGMGVAPEFQAKIFEKYEQVNVTSTRRGSGLGLAFCKLAIEAHQGEIGVANLDSGGSAFWFALPIK